MSARQLLCHLQFQPWSQEKCQGQHKGSSKRQHMFIWPSKRSHPIQSSLMGYKGTFQKASKLFPKFGCLQHLSNIHPCELCTELYAVLQTCGKWTYSRRRLLWISKIERTSGASSAAASNRLEIFFVKEGTPMLHAMSHPTSHKSSSSLEKTRMAFYMPSKHKIFTSWKILWNIAQMKILQILVNCSFYIPLTIVAERDPVNTECSPSPDFGHRIIVLLHRSFTPRVHL